MTNPTDFYVKGDMPYPDDEIDIFDSLKTSANWERLRERSNVDASPDYVALKHDFVNVLMIFAGDLQRQQRNMRKASREHKSTAAALGALDDKIFDSENGAMPRQERRIKEYIDGKVGKLNGVALTILGSVVTGLAVLFLSGGHT